MAEEQGRISRFLSAIGSPFRRRESPTPTMPLWSSGIQEPVMAQGITLPALFAVSNESYSSYCAFKTTSRNVSTWILLGKAFYCKVYSV